MLPACTGLPGSGSVPAPAETERVSLREMPAALPVLPSAPVYIPDDFLHVHEDIVDLLLGKPDLVRREGDGEFRRYAFRQCILVMILYPDPVTGIPVVTHMDSIAGEYGEPRPALEDCLAGGQQDVEAFSCSGPCPAP